MNWTSDDVKFVEKAIEVKNKGMYIDSKQLVERYNKILRRNHGYTSCGSCIRTMITELETALNKFKKELEIKNETVSSDSESVSEVGATVIKEDENKVSEEPRKKVGRPRKNV